AARGCRRPCAHAVEGQDRRLREGAGEDRAGGVALVVVEEEDGYRPPAETAAERPPHVQLAAEPLGHGQREAPQPARGVREIRLQQALEFRKWLLVKRHVI